MHNLLRTLSHEQKTRWPDYLPQLVFSYNSAVHQSTGESPHFLMFGQEPRLPIDFLLGRVEAVEGGGICDWVQEHQRCLQVAFEGARERLQAAAQRRKERYDQFVKPNPLEVGQLVYVRDNSVRGFYCSTADRSFWTSELKPPTVLSPISDSFQRSPEHRRLHTLPGRAEVHADGAENVNKGGVDVEGYKLS
ncbi:hypothetical protein SRHO_G00008190 [Serrasalmus rhombeus]